MVKNTTYKKHFVLLAEKMAIRMIEIQIIVCVIFMENVILLRYLRTF